MTEDMPRVVVAAGMRRGGSTLQYQLVGEILEAVSVPSERRWVPTLSSDEVRALVDGARPVQVLKTHEPLHGSPQALADTRVRVLYIARDPRDGLVSYLRKYSRNFSTMLAKRVLDTIEREFAFWAFLPPSLRSKYEVVVTDLATEISRIAGVLGVELSEAAVRDIASRRSIESQRKRIEAVQWEEKAIRIGADMIDPDSLLHANHIAGGEIEGWRSRLSASQVASIETTHGDLIQRMGYSLSTGAVAASHRGFHRLLRKLRT